MLPFGNFVARSQQKMIIISLKVRQFLYTLKLKSYVISIIVILTAHVASWSFPNFGRINGLKSKHMKKRREGTSSEGKLI